MLSQIPEDSVSQSFKLFSESKTIRSNLLKSYVGGMIQDNGKRK